MHTQKSCHAFTSAILIQAFFNISVVINLLPTKGITLPFISFGGTSLFVTLACMGVLLNVTQGRCRWSADRRCKRLPEGR